MKPVTAILLFIVAAGLFGAMGYQWGKQRPAMAHQTVVKAERKILYYRNPMGLPDTSPTPKQDSMGMDYVPVYEGEAAGSTIAISPERIQLLGVNTELAQLRQLIRTVHATASIQASERNLHWIAPRFEGWVRQLHVNTTGQQVTKGEPLLTVYSPDLQSTAREYQLATQSGMDDLAQSALQRLRNWEVMPKSVDQVPRLATDNLVLRSPVNGVVLEKNVVAGARFASGDILFKLADLSTVWIQADVAEQDQAILHLGQLAKVTVDAYPGTQFSGRVSFISPVLNPQTRTVQVRVELPNRDGKLRPAMFASVQLATEKSPVAVLSVPVSAVIDSGARQIVLVQATVGRFAPRTVKLGQRTNDYVEVLEGLSNGERVVTRANFLLDAESNLKAALGGMQQSSTAEPTISSPLPQAREEQSEMISKREKDHADQPNSVEHHHDQ